MITLSKPTDREVLNAIGLFLLCCIPICLFLFYIDEGNYSLAGLISNPGNIIVMSMYLIAFMVIQACFYTAARLYFKFTGAGVISGLGLIAFVAFLLFVVF